MPNTPKLPISPEAFQDVLCLLRHSWADIEYKYEGLTLNEKCTITPEHFDEIVALLRPDKTVIHFMEQGMTACMFMPGHVPAQWPMGHAWEPNWEMVNCPGCLKGKPPFIDTFMISRDGRSITCLRCKRTSHNAKDVEYHYCSACNVMHDDLWPPGRKWWIEHPHVVSEPLQHMAERTYGKVLARSANLKK